MSLPGKSSILALVLLAVTFLVSHANPVKAGPPASSDASTASAAPQKKTRTVVYYFHGNMRCHSCRKIEAYTVEAIRSGFPEALEDGRLELQVVNVEEPGNDHYVRDFQLYTRSVVVERRAGDKRQEWKNLDKAWRLIRDKAGFMEYVQQETLGMMKED